MEIDHAGNRLRVAGAEGFPTRFGGQCPKLPVYAAFAQAGQVLVEPAELPDGSAFLTIARTLEGPQGAFSERPRRTALLLGCALEAGPTRSMARHFQRLVIPRSVRPVVCAKGRAASLVPSHR